MQTVLTKFLIHELIRIDLPQFQHDWARIFVFFHMMFGFFFLGVRFWVVLFWVTKITRILTGMKHLLQDSDSNHAGVRFIKRPKSITLFPAWIGGTGLTLWHHSKIMRFWVFLHIPQRTCKRKHLIFLKPIPNRWFVSNFMSVWCLHVLAIDLHKTTLWCVPGKKFQTVVWWQPTNHFFVIVNQF